MHVVVVVVVPVQRGTKEQGLAGLLGQSGLFFSSVVAAACRPLQIEAEGWVWDRDRHRTDCIGPHGGLAGQSNPRTNETGERPNEDAALLNGAARPPWSI